MTPKPDETLSKVWLQDIHPSADGGLPDALFSHLFGGHQKTYAIFDTAVVSEGLSLVENDPGYCCTLLMGDEAEKLADVMPCLLQPSQDGLLMKKLFQEVQDVPSAMGSMHLWPANPVLFIRCNASPEQLRRHLRRFMKPADLSGMHRYVRLWNPVIAFDYLRDLAEPTDFLRLYLSGPNDPLTLIARKENEIVIASTSEESVAGMSPVLSDIDIEALTLRVKNEFHERLVANVIRRGQAKGHDFERKRAERIGQKVMSVMSDHKRDDVPKMKDHEKLTLVLLMMHDEATDAVLSGPVLSNYHLPWAKRVDVVAKSYLTALRRMHGLEVT